jgi:hypothetical protein
MGMNLNCWNFDRFPVAHAGQTSAERNCHDFPFGRRAGKQHTILRSERVGFHKRIQGFVRPTTLTRQEQRCREDIFKDLPDFQPQTKTQKDTNRHEINR